MIDGTLDFSGGVNSIKVPTVSSERNTGGLARNELAWLVNGAVRDGGIRPRFGWLNLGDVLPLTTGRFQGAFLYEPTGGDPYFICSIAGRIYRFSPDTPSSVVDLSALFGLTNPADQTYTYFCQGEEFLVIQVGDYVTNGMVWDGTTLRRLGGLLGSATLAGKITVNYTMPAVGGAITFVMDRTYGGSVGDVLRIPTNLTLVGVFPTETVTAYSGNYADIKVTAISGVNLSATIIATTVPGSSVNVGAGQGVVKISGPELPPAGPMDYYMGRIWYGQGKVISAGDIVGGTSGTLAYNFRDSVLKVTENPLAIGGDGFAIPGNDGNLRAVRHSANIDASLGQGRLYLFTRKAVYALQVPVTRDDWINANYDNQPLLTVVQLVNGSVNDRSVVPVNGDLFYRSFEPGVRSLVTAVRNFSQWGNVEISANEQRLMKFEDRALLYASSGIFFNNRLLETALPTDHPYGVTFGALAPMDFIPISGFNQQSAPVWEGMYQGLDILQVAVADFGGLERGFAVSASTETGQFQVWELTAASRRDNVDSRITFQIETPAWTWGDEASLKRLIGGELWVDQLSGTVTFTVHYRPDSESCWHLWHTWEVCNVANSCEDPDNPVCYPITTNPDTYRATMSLPSPRVVCSQATGRPSNVAYQFQCRITIKGWCRVRGLWLHAQPFERSLFSKLQC